MKYFFLPFFLAAPFFALEPAMTLNISPKAIGTNESALVELSVEGEELLEIPQASPSAAYSLSFTGRGSQSHAAIVNGSVSIKNYYTYSYRLTPRKPGTHTVAGMKVQTKRGSFYSPAGQIIIRAKSAMRAPVQQNVFNPFSSFMEDPGNPFLFFVFSRENHLQNTAFLADVYVFSENPAFLDSLNLDTDLQLVYRPVFDGGILYEFTTPPSSRITRIFNGQELDGILLKRYIAYALSTEGKLRPPAYRVRTGVLDFYLQGSENRLNIIAAPKGLGYIGRELQAELKLGTQTIEVGKDTTLSLTIEGDGNADYFTNPFSTQKVEGLYISQPKTELEVGFYQPDDPTRIFMRKTFTYTISPKTSGKLQVPAISLPYTSPEGKPQNFTIAPISLEALPASAASDALSALQPLSVPSGPYAYHSGIGYLIGAWLLGLASILWAWRKSCLEKRLQTDEIFARKTGAKKRLHTALAGTEFALKAGKFREAARILRQSMTSYAADKLGLPSGSSLKEIASNMNEETSSLFLSLSEELTAAAFGSEPTEFSLRHSLDKAQAIFEKIDTTKPRF